MNLYAHMFLNILICKGKYINQTELKEHDKHVFDSDNLRGICDRMRKLWRKLLKKK